MQPVDRALEILLVGEEEVFRLDRLAFPAASEAALEEPGVGSVSRLIEDTILKRPTEELLSLIRVFVSRSSVILPKFQNISPISDLVLVGKSDTATIDRLVGVVT